MFEKGPKGTKPSLRSARKVPGHAARRAEKPFRPSSRLVTLQLILALTFVDDCLATCARHLFAPATTPSTTSTKLTGSLPTHQTSARAFVLSFCSSTREFPSTSCCFQQFASCWPLSCTLVFLISKSKASPSLHAESSLLFPKWPLHPLRTSRNPSISSHTALLHCSTNRYVTVEECFEGCKSPLFCFER